MLQEKKFIHQSLNNSPLHKTYVFIIMVKS